VQRLSKSSWKIVESLFQWSDLKSWRMIRR
jgi:hypothetical protein